MKPMGGCRLLHFLKSKNGCLSVFLCQYIHSFVFPKMARRGEATALLATPLNPPLFFHLNLHVCRLKILVLGQSILQHFIKSFYKLFFNRRGLSPQVPLKTAYVYMYE